MHLLPSALIFCTLLSSISPFAPHPSMLRSQLLRRTLPTSSLTRLFSSLDDQIATKGDEIRKLKESGLDKSSLKPHIAELLALKAQLSPPPVAPSAPAPPAAKPSTPPPSNANSDKITPRATDYSAWYSDIIRHSALAESSATRGAMIIKPWGMSVWESLKRDLDDRIASKDVENCYFPLLIPKSFLSKEAEHVEGFAKECAVVTHHRLCTDPNNPNNLIPDPASLLEEPLIIRPTSETIIWSSFQKWISSHRDLPFKINQWANVLRWELRTRPFLRTSKWFCASRERAARRAVKNAFWAVVQKDQGATSETKARFGRSFRKTRERAKRSESALSRKSPAKMRTLGHHPSHPKYTTNLSFAGEFLWQEGHTAHATAAGANADAKEMILEYSDFVSKMLAMPCVVGVKSPAERFAGAVETFTIETVMGNGWALQSGTSHDLGQTFGKAFDVKFQVRASTHTRREARPRTTGGRLERAPSRTFCSTYPALQSEFQLRVQRNPLSLSTLSAERRPRNAASRKLPQWQIGPNAVSSFWALRSLVSHSL